MYTDVKTPDSPSFACLYVKRRSVPIKDKMLSNVLARQAVAPAPGNDRMLQEKIAAVPEIPNKMRIIKKYTYIK